MAIDPTAGRVLAGYQSQMARIRESVEQIVRRAWGPDGMWRGAEAERFASEVVPVMEGGQLRIAAMTAAYLAAVEAAVTGRIRRPFAISREMVSTESLRGVDAREVWRRPAVTARTEISNGAEVGAAVTAGLARALALAATDLQLARTHTTTRALRSTPTAVGYRREPSGETCELCALAADRIYSTGDLMPIHDHCNCGVTPIFRNADPGQAFDSDQPVTGPRLSEDQTLAVRRHGELGPVLTVASHAFRGPSDL